MKGIAFTGWSLERLRAGQKTQTRRPVKPQPPEGFTRVVQMPLSGETSWNNNQTHETYPDAPKLWVVPRYRPGEVVYVKEAAYIAPPNFGDNLAECNCIDFEGRPRLVGYATSMDGEAIRCAEDYGVKRRWPLLMPAWAARDWLRILTVRAERVREISSEDCIAEGLSSQLREYDAEADLREKYFALYDSMHGVGAHERDWVWVYTFERLSREEEVTEGC